MAVSLDLTQTRQLLETFKFGTIFREELGWSKPSQTLTRSVSVEGVEYTLREIAQLSGATVFEVTAPDGEIPDARTRGMIQRKAAEMQYENLLIFVDSGRKRSLWRWVKRAEGKPFPREHHFVAGQPGDLFLSKLAGLIVDISEFDAKGELPITKVAQRMERALDVERVTKRFFKEFQEQHDTVLESLTGIADERDRKWYVSVLLNRLMFVYFLQGKGFLPGNRYLQVKLAESKARGEDLFYAEFLAALFFEGFALPEDMRSKAIKAMVGPIVYLNGGLFLRHRIELENPDIAIPDAAFDELLRDDANPKGLFARYSWNLDDTPGGSDNEMAPGTLGYIFEQYINNKEFGAYYTCEEITEYLCEQTIDRLILDKVNAPAIPGVSPARQFENRGELMMRLDADLCRKLFHDVLPHLSLLDPACGSGAFLVAAMKTLTDVYGAVIGKIEFLPDSPTARLLREQLATIRKEHPSINYFIKREIIKNNLYGVDINPEAVEIARLRLFLALIASARTVNDLEPLPNIDFNLLPGNSLVGFLRVTPDDFDKTAQLGEKTFGDLVREKSLAIRVYKEAKGFADDPSALRRDADKKRERALPRLNDLLLKEFARLGVRYEQATWDDATDKQGKPVKRALTPDDIDALDPFHWAYEFPETLRAGADSGFDAIITNPPWEIFKPQDKEFFEEIRDKETTAGIFKNKMTIKDFEERKDELLEDEEIREAYLEYLSRFPHVSAYFRSAPQYANQISVINGKKAGTDINLYKLFTEQCCRLLRPGGYCGIVIPSGIYTDLGAKQLREMLFDETRLFALFGLSNEKFIFQNVHHAFKLCFMAFQKGGPTEAFEAAFRINPPEAIRREELDWFFRAKSEHVTIPTALVRALSPDSLSVTEFKNPLDFTIADKMARFPTLGDRSENLPWQAYFVREFDMTMSRRLFKDEGGSTRAPLVQGGMIHQYDCSFAPPKYWIDIAEGRAALLGRTADTGQKLLYQKYRLTHRRIARNSDTRTLIATVLPPNRFCADTAQSVRNIGITEMLSLCALLNSFVADYEIRQKVTTHCDMHFMYSLHIPRLKVGNPGFEALAVRAAKLICITPEFDVLAQELAFVPKVNRGISALGLPGNIANFVARPTIVQYGVTDPAERAQLRAEIDAIVAHLYGITEDEFAHILATFPLVPAPVKQAALNAYRDIANGLIVQLGEDPAAAELRALIAGGETETLECKVAAKWNAATGKIDNSMADNIVQAVASFLNAGGGTLLIGVRDDLTIAGLDEDFIAVNAQKPGPNSYELFLRQIIGDRIGKQFADLWSVRYVLFDGKTLCRIDIRPADEPAYLNSGDLYIRDGGKKSKMSVRDAYSYLQRRFSGKKKLADPAPDAAVDPASGLFGGQTMLIE